MIFDKFRMASDLERIKAANSLREEEAESNLRSSVSTEGLGPVGVKDFFAMVIAIFSLLLPYVAVIIAAIVIFTALIMNFWS